MADIPIEQAIYGNPQPGGFRFLARSPGFLDEWLPLAERMCGGFGERPAGIAVPGALFVQPLGRGHVAVVQVADLGCDDAGRPGALAFRLLVLTRRNYADLTGDPFLLADRFPPSWQERGALPTLLWTGGPPAPRTLAQVREVLLGADSATLLGGTQALIDGGRLVFERPAPAPDLVRRLWVLLPTSTRSELWPATFAFGNALGFDVLIVPRADFEQYARYLREEQAGDFPDGRYEHVLQAVTEAGDEAQLTALLARRSSAQTVRLGLIILAGMIVLAVVMNYFNPPPASHRRQPPGPPPTTAVEPVSRDKLPNLDDCTAPLAPDMEKRLGTALRELAAELGGTMTPTATVADALDSVGVLLERHASALPRNGAYARLRSERKLDHPEQQLRAWLWRFEVKEYDDRRLNVVELVELLKRKLVP